MELRTENERRVLYADEGYVLKCKTDGLVVGESIMLGRNDSEIHYVEVKAEDELPS